MLDIAYWILGIGYCDIKISVFSVYFASDQVMDLETETLNNKIWNKANDECKQTEILIILRFVRDVRMTPIFNLWSLFISQFIPTHHFIPGNQRLMEI